MPTNDSNRGWQAANWLLPLVLLRTAAGRALDGHALRFREVESAADETDDQFGKRDAFAFRLFDEAVFQFGRDADFKSFGHSDSPAATIP
jgi:hypothetical protein